MVGLAETMRVLVVVVLMSAGTFMFLWTYLLLQANAWVRDAPRGDCNVIADDWTDMDREKRNRVVFWKCVRARYWWNGYVVGYYRWRWVAEVVCWIVFKFNTGDCHTQVLPRDKTWKQIDERVFTHG